MPAVAHTRPAPASVTPIGARRHRQPLALVKGDKAAAIGRTGRTVAADLRRWWGATTSPPDLTTWLAARTPKRIPDDDPRLRIAWQVDHWTSGLLLVVLSAALFLPAAGIRWVACHPARRWIFLALLVTTAGIALA